MVPPVATPVEAPVQAPVQKAVAPEPPPVQAAVEPEAPAVKLVATKPDDADLGKLRDAVSAALDEQGHNTAASLLGAGRWKLGRSCWQWPARSRTAQKHFPVVWR